ncbi:lectin-like domain-containing protein [Streptococcus parasanguinis]|uniref:lectin-like domain-containing protein n=1 Tax=Streptococcus parasanguinis TaxID=1318 RepID=UPI0011DDB275|nr:Ig-like domain-containing protein [Streptococcus parasanguinis]
MYFNRKNAQQKNWRMIKKGKHFLFGCSLVFAIGATLAAPTVKADSVEDKAEATVPTSSEATGNSTTYVAPAVTTSTETSTATSATTASTGAETVPSLPLVDKTKLEVVLAQAKAKNLDGQEASVKAEVAAAIAEAEALVADGTASQAEVNQSVERLTQAVASVKEATTVATEATSGVTTEATTTTRVRNRRSLSEGTSRAVDETRLDRVTVTKDNFDSFFKEGGTANYDETSGTIKLTDDVSGQVGSAYLRFKIDPKEDFTFTGKVDIGDKYEGHQVNGRDGGDGVGFVFHTGNVDTIGQSGASIGMGTIKNAFGFKLDSWHNTTTPNASHNAPADPKYGGNAWRSNAFGAFYSSNAAGRVTTVGDAKALNPNPNGQWVDFKIEYKGQTKEFIVTYGNEKWSTNLKTANASTIAPNAKTALNNSNATYALSFLGSTGSGTNLQRVQIEKFEFTAPQIVQVAFYDEAGNELAASSAIPGDRDQVVNLSNIEAVQKAITKIKAKGYTLKEVNSDKAETYNSGANTVTLRSGGQLLKYVFKEADSKGVKAPTTKTPVQDTTALTQPEKDAVKAAVEAANPGAQAEVSANGDTTVTFPDGTTATLTGAQTVKEADSKGVKAPTTKTPVQDTTALTQPEKDAVKAAVEAANPGAQAEVSANGDTTVTFPDGTTATLTGAKTVYSSEKGELPDSFDLPKLIITKWVDEDGNELKPADAKAPSELGESNEAFEHGEIDGYVFVRTLTDETEGTVTHIFRKLQDTTAPTAPVVNPVKAGDTTVTGTAEAGSTVEVTLPDGSKVSAKADQDGNFSVPVSGLKEGTTVSVTATDDAGNTSTPTTATVAKADDKIAPTAPVVNPVKAGDTAVTGTAEAGSTVEVTLPDGSKVSAKADQDGNFSVPVSGLKEGTTVSVTATDDAGNTSTPTTATVAKADDKTTPTAPVVNPVKAGGTTLADKSELDLIKVQPVRQRRVATISSKKSESGELPNTGEEQSVASIVLAILSALTGGLLISKKRKDEE